MENQIIVHDWGTIIPHQWKVPKVAGEPNPKPYQHKYPFAVIFFKKVKKEYGKEMLCSGIRSRNLRSINTGERYTMQGVERKLEHIDEPSAPRYKRIVKADAIIEW